MGVEREGEAGPGGAVLKAAGLVLGCSGQDFRINVVGEDGTVLLPLGPYDESDVIAEWRKLAESSGLPPLYVAPDGRLRELHAQIGRIRLGGRRDGRRLAVLAGRRPRFLVRRKAGTFPARPRVFAGRELAGGRNA